MSIKIKSIKKVILEKPEKFYDITVEKYHNFIIGDSKIVCHNSSMAQAISKLARPFSCAEQILLGDGFFGTPVNPAPSAPRYTQVKISSKYKEIIEKYKDLNIPNEEGGYDWIHVDYPIGLSTHVVGIAVGYKSNILPSVKLNSKFLYLALFLADIILKCIKLSLAHFLAFSFCDSE
jgi:hypothetical protein